ncbi:MAG: ribonuclease PH [Chloroflexi bacterium]|nr:ribonuclease PH [Chloroflexota bacterium]
MRLDKRQANELRKLKFITDYQEFALASVLVESGKTKVICAVSVEDKVPIFLKGEKQGWITAEYAMLPGSTDTRSARETLRPAGRSQEISRLIGRSLRAVFKAGYLGERTLLVDCDVLQADGGTRTAAISGAYVAVYIACLQLIKMGVICHMPLSEGLAAVSGGIVDGQILLDLAYNEDAAASSDFNIVATESGSLVEIQGSAEKAPYSLAKLNEVLILAQDSIKNIIAVQKAAIDEWKLIHG